MSLLYRSWGALRYPTLHQGTLHRFDVPSKPVTWTSVRRNSSTHECNTRTFCSWKRHTGLHFAQSIRLKIYHCMQYLARTIVCFWSYTTAHHSTQLSLQNDRYCHKIHNSTTAVAANDSTTATAAVRDKIYPCTFHM